MPSGSQHRQQKTRFAAGSDVHNDDSTDAETCSVGVISPVKAIIKGDSIPKPYFDISKYIRQVNSFSKKIF